MTYETTIFKGRDGWQAETKIPLGISRAADFRGVAAPLVLFIVTDKHTRSGVSSSAAVFGVYGESLTHMFAFDEGGDFSLVIEHDRAARCTENAVRVMHSRALTRAAGLVDRALAFYASKATKAA